MYQVTVSKFENDPIPILNVFSTKPIILLFTPTLIKLDFFDQIRIYFKRTCNVKILIFYSIKEDMIGYML